jgi:NAD(P)-dependent dehydrogenase (short-subunit alcohol dehydrogenase family)
MTIVSVRSFTRVNQENQMLLQNKTAVIYGGGGAIGGAVARVFAREGARILDAVAAEVAAAGGTVETARLDVLDQRAVEEHAEQVAEAGGIDIALNAISVMHDQGTTLADLSLNDFMRPIDGFLKSLFITSKAVAPHMGGKRPGVILMLSEPGARLAVGGILGHAASGAGKEAFSRVLAAELGPRNIRVICIRPHAIADAPAAGSYTKELFQPMAAAARLPLQEWMAGLASGTMLNRLPSLAEVAETAAFLASDHARGMTATIVNVTGGALVD